MKDNGARRAKRAGKARGAAAERAAAIFKMCHGLASEASRLEALDGSDAAAEQAWRRGQIELYWRMAQAGWAERIEGAGELWRYRGRLAKHRLPDAEAIFGRAFAWAASLPALPLDAAADPRAPLDDDETRTGALAAFAVPLLLGRPSEGAARSPSWALANSGSQAEAMLEGLAVPDGVELRVHPHWIPGWAMAEALMQGPGAVWTLLGDLAAGEGAIGREAAQAKLEALGEAARAKASLGAGFGSQGEGQQESLSDWPRLAWCVFGAWADEPEKAKELIRAAQLWMAPKFMALDAEAQAAASASMKEDLDAAGFDGEALLLAPIPLGFALEARDLLGQLAAPAARLAGKALREGGAESYSWEQRGEGDPIGAPMALGDQGAALWWDPATWALGAGRQALDARGLARRGVDEGLQAAGLVRREGHFERKGGPSLGQALTAFGEGAPKA